MKAWQLHRYTVYNGIYGIYQEPACLGFKQWISEINISKVNDAYFRFVCDMGKPGPDKGNGGQDKFCQPPWKDSNSCAACVWSEILSAHMKGKYLIVPPGYDGQIPDGYFVFHSPTYTNFVVNRGRSVQLPLVTRVMSCPKWLIQDRAVLMSQAFWRMESHIFRLHCGGMAWRSILSNANQIHLRWNLLMCLGRPCFLADHSWVSKLCHFSTN